jgi:hypothetical protein
MSLLPVRDSVEFSKSAGTVTFNLYNDITFDSQKSCSGCDILDTVYLPNVPYLALMTTAQNEGSLLLSMTCTTAQISAMTPPITSSYCKPAQLNNASVTCVCCSAATPTPSGAIPCSSLLTPTTKPGGIVSWLAKYDNTLKLRDQTTSFSLASEIYAPILRQMTVSEVVFGTVSGLLGFFRTTDAIKRGDKQSLYKYSNTTYDLGDACAANCPTVSQVKLKFQQALGSGKPLSSADISCHGLVPNYVDLIATLGEERALELRYLEGVSCKPFTVTLAINALVLTDPNAVKVCADGSTPTLTKPCCLKQYKSTTFGLTGGGLGCHFWVNGLVQSRRVYSEPEAIAYLEPSPETQV